MSNIIIAPGKYVQGKGELSKLGGYVEKLGSKPFILVSPSGMKRVKEPITKSFGATPPLFEEFCGECSKKEINRLIGKMGGFAFSGKSGLLGQGGNFLLQLHDFDDDLVNLLVLQQHAGIVRKGSALLQGGGSQAVKPLLLKEKQLSGCLQF